MSTLKITPDRPCFRNQYKVAFNGNKRNKYESWQFSKTYRTNTRLYTIVNGIKYVREDCCSSRRNGQFT